MIGMVFTLQHLNKNVVEKRRILPDQYIVRQGDEANTAFLILSGSLEVQIDGKKLAKWKVERFLVNYR